MNPRDVPEEWVIAFRAKLEEHAGRLGAPGNLHEAIRHALADVIEMERAAVAARFDIAIGMSTNATDVECLTSAAAFVRTGLYLAAKRSAP